MLLSVLTLLVAATDDGCYPYEWEAYGFSQPCTDSGLMAYWKLPPKALELARAAWKLGKKKEAGDAWLAAIRSAPDRLELLVAMAMRMPDDAADAVLAGVEATKDPPAAVRLLIRGFNHTYVVALWAVEHDPRPAELLALPYMVESSPEGIATGLRGLQRAKADPATAAKWADAVLRAALQLELISFSADFYAKLPPDVRARIDRGEERRSPLDLRRTLAVTLAAAGRSEPSARLAKVGAPDKLKGDSRPERGCNTDLDAFALGGPSPGTYEVSVALRTCSPNTAAMLVLRDKVPARDREMLQHMLGWRPRYVERKLTDIEHSKLATRAKPELDLIAAAAREDLKLFPAAPKDEKEEPPAADGRAPLWVEKPWNPKAAAGAAPCKAKLPKGFGAVTAQKVKGGGCVAIAASQALDPTGEVSQGGYWLFRSRDGQTWQRGYYLGLRVFRPYQVVEGGKLAAFENDTVRLLVERKELDESSIFFPPVATTFKSESGPMVLEASWADLSRDSDGDGLTDVEEERMMLDLRNPDTDGDGMKDGDDALPNVADAPQPTREAEALNAVLERLSGGAKPAALLTTPSPKGAKPKIELPRPFASGPLNVTFLSGEPSRLKGLRSLEPVVVLTPAQEKEAHAKFGASYPMSLDIIVDEKGERCFVEWSEHWRGGSMEGTRENGVWKLVEISSWIT